MNTEKIHRELKKLQVKRLNSQLAFIYRDSNSHISSLTEALLAGKSIIREKAGLVTVTNTGSQPIVILAGEPLIEPWHMRVTLLAPSGFVLFIPPSYLAKNLTSDAEMVSLKKTPWQAGAAGLVTPGSLEVLPTPGLAAQYWPLFLAKQENFVIEKGTVEDFLAQLDNLTITPLSTVGAGAAFSLWGTNLRGRALLNRNQLVHLYMQKIGDKFWRNCPGASIAETQKP
jgi:hypothetical protein